MCFEEIDPDLFSPRSGQALVESMTPFLFDELNWSQADVVFAIIISFLIDRWKRDTDEQPMALSPDVPRVLSSRANDIVYTFKLPHTSKSSALLHLLISISEPVSSVVDLNQGGPRSKILSVFKLAKNQSHFFFLLMLLKNLNSSFSGFFSFQKDKSMFFQLF